MKLTILSGLSVVLLAGCGRDEVQTYRVPKEKTAAPEVQAAPAMQQPATGPSAKGFTADLPAGWKEVPPSSAMRLASYAIAGTEIDFYLISLSMGDVESNVSRWCGQVGLADSTATLDVLKNAVVLNVDGHRATYVEMLNEETGAGILAAIIDLSPNYWYFTAKGTVDELKANAADIRKFIETIKLEGHSH